MAEGAVVVAQEEASRLRDALARAQAEGQSRGAAAEAQAAEATRRRAELEAALVAEREKLADARESFAHHAPHRVPHRRSQSPSEEGRRPARTPGAEIPGSPLESPSHAGPATQAAVSPSNSGPARR